MGEVEVTAGRKGVGRNPDDDSVGLHWPAQSHHRAAGEVKGELRQSIAIDWVGLVRIRVDVGRPTGIPHADVELAHGHLLGEGDGQAITILPIGFIEEDPARDRQGVVLVEAGGAGTAWAFICWG